MTEAHCVALLGRTGTVGVQVPMTCNVLELKSDQILTKPFTNFQLESSEKWLEVFLVGKCILLSTMHHSQG